MTNRQGSARVGFVALALFLTSATASGWAADESPQISCTAMRHGSDVVLALRVPAGQTYELYADRLRVRLPGDRTSALVATAAIAPTAMDSMLGHVVVRGEAAATLTVPVQAASIEVTYQGCDPVHGICYLPQTMTVAIH